MLNPQKNTFARGSSEKIVHELRVHQIELKIQNEELKRLQLESESSNKKYQVLYDFAPIGYFTLSHRGLIKEVNLTGASLLGVARQKLINRGFGHFVDYESWANLIYILPAWLNNKRN